MSTNIPTPPPREPLAVSVTEASELSDLGISRIWELIADGTLAVKRVGRRTLINYQSLKLPAKPLLMENGEPKRKPGSDKVEHVNLLKFDRYANRWFTSTLLIALDEFLAANHLTLPNPKDH